MHMDMFPVWSPHSDRLAFARSTYRGNDEDTGTDLCTVPREGGEIEVLATLSEDSPYLVSSTMFWDPDGSILYATHPRSSDPADNGLFQVLNDGSINAISQGLLAAGMPIEQQGSGRLNSMKAATNPRARSPGQSSASCSRKCRLRA